MRRRHRLISSAFGRRASEIGVQDSGVQDGKERPGKTWSNDEVADLRRRLDEDGYAVIRGVVAPDACDTFALEVLDQYEKSDRFTGGGSFSGHLNCFPGRSSRIFYDALVDHGIVEAIRVLRPHQVGRVRATLNFNLPKSVAQHYHTDGLYIEDFLICNVAVVDTVIFNGAIDVLPGTQRHYWPFWKFAIQRLGRRTTRLPMQRGDVLVRRSTLWHRGMPNNSATARPMMSLTFGESAGTEGDPFEVHDGKMFFYPNWFSTSRLGQLREKTFVASPLSYSAFRFVKSLHGKPGLEHW